MLGNKTGGERDHKSASHAEQTAEKDQLYHGCGEKVENASNSIDSQTYAENHHLVFRSAYLSRTKDEGNGDKIRQNGEKLYLKFCHILENLIEFSHDRRYGKPRQVDYERY